MPLIFGSYHLSNSGLGGLLLEAGSFDSPEAKSYRVQGFGAEGSLLEVAWLAISVRILFQLSTCLCIPKPNECIPGDACNFGGDSSVGVSGFGV